MTDKLAKMKLTNPYKLIEQVEQANSRQELDELIAALAELGRPAITALLEKQPGLVTSRLHMIAAEVFARMGYPLNAEAVSFIVSDVSNVNSRTYKISVNSLLAIGRPALPEIDRALEYYRRDDDYSKEEIESLEEIKSLLNQ